MADDPPFVPNIPDKPPLPDPLPPDWNAPATPGFVPNTINRSSDFIPRRFTDPAAPPPPLPPSLPDMSRGELRDMLHAAAVHILDLERRVTALEPPPAPLD